MIQVKELISENILYSCKWNYSEETHYLYLTQNKLYEYKISSDCSTSYSYDVVLLKNIESVHCGPSSIHNGKAENYIVNFSNAYKEPSGRSFRFNANEEGKKLAEELFVAISKLID